MTLRSNLAVETENQRFFAGLAAPGVLWWLNCVWLMNPRRVNDPCAPWGWYLPFVTRETALTPPLGSSNGPFLAVPAVFLWFRPGVRCPKGLKALLFPVVYAQKSQRKQTEFDNAPLRHVVMKFRPFLGAPMPLTRPNPPEPPGTAGVAMRPAIFRVGVRRSGRVSPS